MWYDEFPWDGEVPQEVEDMVMALSVIPKEPVEPELVWCVDRVGDYMVDLVKTTREEVDSR